MGSLWNRSGMIERQDDDIRAAGALAYFFSGGTTTPLTVYSDAGESAAHTHPVVADANGRWPDVFVPYIVGYDVRVTTDAGVQLSYTQNIPNPDPIDLSVTIPATNQVQTGMIHAELINATKSGYVRLNGRTIGNAVSGATERANADTSDLFAYLWNSINDTFATVSGGRGGSAASDFAANKTIILPSLQGCVVAGLGDMGNSDPGVFTGLTFLSGDATTAASVIGLNQGFLEEDQLPPHAHTGTTSSDGSHSHGGATGTQSANHTHTVSGTSGSGSAHHHTVPIQAQGSNVGAGGVSIMVPGGSTDTSDESSHTHSINFASQVESGTHTHSIASDGTHNHTFTTSTVGSGNPFNNMPLTRLVTWFIKL